MITGFGPGVPGADGTAFIDGAQMDSFKGKQGQLLTPVITDAWLPETPFSALEVTMPGGTRSLAHMHTKSVIAIRVIEGRAATLVGDDLDGVVIHGPGEWVYIPAGVAHVAVNLSETDILTAIEVRTDPKGDDDTFRLPRLEDRATELANKVRRRVL